MNKDKKSDTTAAETSSAKGTRSTATTAADIDARVDQENKQGFRGIEVDPTPNENYTLAGVVAGKPTPETDVASAKDVRMETGLGLSPLEAAERERAQQRGKK
jgi:hypothetical protein